MTTTQPTTSRTILWSQRRSRLWRHAFVFLWLFFATWSAVVADPQSAARWASSLVLVAVLGGWYWYWQGSDAHRGIAGTARRRVYLLGAVAVWVPLVALDPVFLVAGVSVFAPYCLDSVRWAMLTLVPCTGTWLWQDVTAHGGPNGAQVVVALLVVASGVAVAGYVGALTRQNTERQALIDQLQAAQSELAAAEHRAGVLAERQRLARDIHDTLTQGFASIVMLLEAADASLDAGHTATRHVGRALRSARDNLAESRRVVWALRPEALTDGHLPDAIGDLVTHLADETGLYAEFVVTGTPRGLGPETDTALLRLAQEALANVRKHAAATRVTVTVSYMDDLTVLDIQDDGTGFDPSRMSDDGQRARGLGLRAMRERAEELDGRLTVETAPGEGTTVVAEIPATAVSDTTAGSPPSPPGRVP